MPSSASRLRSDLNDITEKLVDLIDGLVIERFGNSSEHVVFIAPDFYWGEPTPEQTSLQLGIKRDYEEWFELFNTLFAKAPNDLTRRIEEADQTLRGWIELESNWSITHDRAANGEQLREDVKRFLDLLDIVGNDQSNGVILIPDTNAFADEPDPVKYRPLARSESFSFLLLPTVLEELDDLKRNHRNPDFRDKVNKAIKRLKGWRNQGPLRRGVTVDRTIAVRSLAHEPDMEHTLAWLSKDVKDDRIIASVLETQAENPAARVVLVTGDINLMNKADFARVECAELPG